MKALNSVNKSKISLYICWAGVFGLMLLLNCLTHYYADDYAYMYSFMTTERLKSFFDLFPSIYSHYFKMNGRLPAHFFAQLFLMLPKFIFNVINALMFLSMLLLINRLANRDKKTNCVLFILSFCAIWVFQPAFGQVNLWLDGSVNYLWSAVFAMLFLLPYINAFEERDILSSLPRKMIFIVFCLIAGGYSENTSAASIAGAFFLMAVTFIQKKSRLNLTLIAGWAAACVGFIIMALSPAGISKKVAAFDIDVLIGRLGETFTRLCELKWLLLLWIILFIIAIAVKTKRDRIMLSVIYLVTGLFANFILMFSTYYPLRSMCSVTVFITAAVFTLIWEIYEDGRTRAVNVISVILVLLSVIPLYNGGRDIWHTHLLCGEAYSYIDECKADGIYDIELPYIWGATKYSPINDLKYLDTEDSSTWPNKSMAKYFEVDSIIGYY